MSITWQQVFQPKTTRAVKRVNWRETIDLGPVVSFSIVPMHGQLAVAQAYPKGTGNTVSDKVDWIMDRNEGPFQFGIRDDEGGATLVARLASAIDIAAFAAAFPAATA
jgi:hypothetical protein